MTHQSAGTAARTKRHQDPSSRAETVALALGITFFIIGLLALIAIFVIHATGGAPVTPLYFVSLLFPLGLTVGVFTTIINGARRRRRRR